VIEGWAEFVDPDARPLESHEKRRLTIERMRDGRRILIDQSPGQTRAIIGDVALLAVPVQDIGRDG
jgi:hypothetical protein